MTAPGLRDSIKLDAHHGPASRISRTRAAEMVERAIERADVAELPPRTLRQPRRLSPALWVSVALVASSVIVAGGAFLVAKRRGAPARFWTELPLASLLGNETSSEVAVAGLSSSEILAKADELRSKGQWLAAT